MAAKKENNPRQTYKIKLLAGNNVVLIEADKYESEVFAPQIVNGRIAFLNIIPNRRCCPDSKTSFVNYAKNASREQPLMILNEQNVKLAKSERLSGGHSLPTNAPLANSTPVDVKKRSNCGNRLLSNCGISTDNTQPTPEPVRDAVPARTVLWDKPMPSLSRGVKRLQNQPNTSEGTPKNVQRVVPSAMNSNCFGNGTNVSLLSASFRFPRTPSISSSPKSKRLDSISSWQKVLTPVRTYTRKSSNAIIIRRPVLVKSARKLLKSKYKPTYLVNPTKGPDVSQHIEMLKRKIIIDTKICISPKTFKKQQKEALNTKTGKTKPYPQSLSFHKPLPYLETMNLTAFDMLTNSNRSRIMSRKLNEQFRKGCVNKASSTYSKYKILSAVPPLHQDDQVLQMSTISLLD